MERLKNLSWAAFIIFIGSLIIGLREFEKTILELDFNVYLYVFFIFLLRFKMALDDNFYFGVTKMERWQSQIGLGVGASSWFLFIFAGYYISDIHHSVVLLLWSIAISTFWIFLTSIGGGYYREQKIWLVTNAAYLAGLGTLLWLATLKVTNGESQTEDSFTIIGSATSIVLVLLVVITIVDFKVSKSMANAFD